MSTTDFISQLPDSLLIHILSFMTTKAAMRACLVAKQWRKLWAYIPVLDFSDFHNDDHIFDTHMEIVYEQLISQGLNLDPFPRIDFDPSSFTRSLSLDVECHHKFERFVQAVLSLRKTSQLDTFKFPWVNSSSDSDVILDVLKLSPRVLQCSMKLSVHSRKLLDHLFTCVSLEEMVLRIQIRSTRTMTIIRHLSGSELNNIFCGPERVFLPRLKILHLSSFEIDPSFRDKLLSGCPLLEELTLQHCSLLFSEISSSTLKHFVLEHHRGREASMLLFRTGSINLYSLKSCALFGLPIQANFMNKLMLGCPLLENLKLSHCRLSVSEISSNSLKYLEFDDCDSEEGTQVSTPNLLYLCMNTDDCDSRISFKFMPSLIRADILFGSIWIIRGESSILSFLSNVTSLNIKLYELSAKVCCYYK
jgi:F-box-like